jgi:hypothetical protein
VPSFSLIPLQEDDVDAGTATGTSAYHAICIEQ